MIWFHHLITCSDPQSCFSILLLLNTASQYCFSMLLLNPASQSWFSILLLNTASPSCFSILLLYPDFSYCFSVGAKRQQLRVKIFCYFSFEYEKRFSAIYYTSTPSLSTPSMSIISSWYVLLNNAELFHSIRFIIIIYFYSFLINKFHEVS